MKKSFKSYVIISCLNLLVLLAYPVKAMTDLSLEDSAKSTLHNPKLNRYIIGAGAAYAAGIVALNQIWYKDHERESFHFFNDTKEWKQMDKLGHFYSTYQISQLGTNALLSANVDKDKAYKWGGMIGFFALLPIEVMDGYSSEYGASWGDLIANFTGSAFLTGQYVLWDEVKVHAKYSFHPDRIAKHRPELLGHGLHEQMIKNYNGMTYWLSFDLYGIGHKGNRIPKWLNLAIGYSAKEMISSNDGASRIMGYDPYRQYFIGLDIDLTYIPTESRFLKTLLYFVNMIRLPSPALEYNRKDGLVFHPIYF